MLLVTLLVPAQVAKFFLWCWRVSRPCIERGRLFEISVSFRYFRGIGLQSSKNPIEQEVPYCLLRCETPPLVAESLCVAAAASRFAGQHLERYSADEELLKNGRGGPVPYEKTLLLIFMRIRQRPRTV